MWVVNSFLSQIVILINRPYQEENARRAGTASIAKKKIEACDRPLAIKFQACGGVCFKKPNILFPKDLSHFCLLIFNLTCYFNEQTFATALSFFELVISTNAYTACDWSHALYAFVEITSPKILKLRRVVNRTPW